MALAGLKSALSALGLLEPARAARNVAWAARFLRPNLRYWREGAPDGLPIPPLSLRILVAGSPNIGWFLDSGRRGALTVRTALARQGRDVGS